MSPNEVEMMRSFQVHAHESPVMQSGDAFERTGFAPRTVNETSPLTSRTRKITSMETPALVVSTFGTIR